MKINYESHRENTNQNRPLSLEHQFSILESATYWEHINGIEPHYLDGWEIGRLHSDIRLGKIEVYDVRLSHTELVAKIRNTQIPRFVGRLGSGRVQSRLA